MRNRIDTAQGLGVCCLLLALGGCGGGGGDGASSSPVPSLALAIGATTVAEGGAAVALSLAGVASANGSIAWSLSPAIGSLVSVSSSGASYVPPPIDVVTGDTTVTITATPGHGAPVSQQVVVTLAPFSVVSASPQAKGVDIHAVPSVTFTRSVAAASLSASSVLLSSPIAPVPASPSASGASVSVTPARSLVWGSHYTTSLTAAVSSSKGQSLTPFTFEFDTQSPAWNTPAPIASSTFTTGVSKPAFDGQGNAFAVWMQDTDGNGNWNIFAARYSKETKGWSAPTNLQVGAMSYSPSVAADEAGNSIAVWQQDAGNGTTRIYAARYSTADGTWGGPQPMPPPTSNSGLAPKVTIDRAGNAIVVWQQYTDAGISQQIYAAHYAGQFDSWSSPVALSGPNDARDPQVKMDDQGNAMATWIEANDGFTFQATARRYVASTDTWSTKRVIQSGTAPAYNPQVAVDVLGNAVAVWTQDQLNGMYAVQAARYSVAADTWAAPELLPAGAGTSNWPQVQIDIGGNIIVLWEQIHGANVYSVNVARRDSTAGTWSFPPALDGIAPANFVNPFVGIPTLTADAAGNAMAFWPRDVGNYDNRLFGARYSSSSRTWSAATQMSMSDGTAAVGPSGEVLVLWGQDIGFNVLNPYWTMYAGE